MDITWVSFDDLSTWAFPFPAAHPHNTSSTIAKGDGQGTEAFKHQGVQKWKKLGNTGADKENWTWS